LLASNMAKQGLVDMENAIVECFEKKRSDKFNSLFAWFCGEKDFKTVDTSWFKKGSSTKMDNKEIQKMLKAFLMGIFNLLEGSKKNVNTKALADFLIGKCKLSKLIVNSLKSDSGESRVKDGCHQVLFLSMYLIKQIVKNRKYSSSPCINELLRGKCVEALIGIILADAKNILTVAAVDLLCCFCMNHREACDIVAEQDGLDAINFFFEKDRAQKYLVKVGKDQKHFYLDRNFDCYEVSEVDPYDTIKPIDWIVVQDPKPTTSLDVEHAMQKQLQTGYALRKSAAKILVKIADGSNSFRKQVYNNEQVVKAMLDWLSYPFVSSNNFTMYEASTTLITKLLQSEDISMKMMRDHNLLRIIEVGVFCPIWRISRQFQCIAHIIAKHAGKVRAKLVESEDMFTVFAAELYSVDQTVTVAADVVASKKKEVNQLEKTLRDTRKENRDLQNQLTGIMGQMKYHENEIEQLKSEIQIVNGEIHEEHLDLQNRTNEMTERIAFCEGEMSNLKNQIDEMQKQLQVKPHLWQLLTTLAQGNETANALYKAGLTPQALMDTDHYYGHACEKGGNGLADARQALYAYVKEWKKAEENLIIKNHKEEKHIRCKVEHMKQNGNDAFQAQRYKEAIDLYTEAIGKCPIRILCPDGTNCPSFNSGVSKEESLYHWWVVPAQLFGNRAQCHLKLEDWKSAVADCTRALCACWIPDNEGGPSRKKIFVKVTYRRARAWFELKDYHRALNDMACCVQEEPNDEILKKFYNECLLLYRKHHGRELIAHCANCGAGDGYSLRRCGNCYQFYCSTQCQAADWENGHQEWCDKFKE